MELRPIVISEGRHLLMVPALPGDGTRYGDAPHRYRHISSRTYSREAFVKTFELNTADSFEAGDAYSLHPTLQEAQKHKQESWWYQGDNQPKKVFITKRTLDSLVRRKGRVIFNSWMS